MTDAMLGDRIIIRNDQSELRRMTGWLKSFTDAANLPPELAHRIDVCANEAVTNIISYAYDDYGRHEISLEVSETSTGVSLVIRDDGRPFDFTRAPPHQIPATLEEAEIGNLGIHLIRRLMTRCDYRREGGANILTLEAQARPQAGNA
jgi:anti-sigma regulatory factor (Ser/Thr protein kinase)